jgi:hypothetical protein
LDGTLTSYKQGLSPKELCIRKGMGTTGLGSSPAYGNDAWLWGLVEK